MGERQRPLCFGTDEFSIKTPGKKHTFICGKCWAYEECAAITPKKVHRKIKIPSMLAENGHL